MTPDPSAPKKPWRLSENDRKFLRSMKIDPNDEPEPNVCDSCDGTGRVIGKVTTWIVCPVCRGLGRLET